MTTNTRIDIQPTLTDVIVSSSKPDASGPSINFYQKNFKNKTTGANERSAASDVRADIYRMSNVFEKAFYPKWVQGIKDYTMSTLDRRIELRRKNTPDNSNVKQPIIRTFCDRLQKAIQKANFTVQAQPLSSADKDKVDSVQYAIDWCFSSSKARDAILQVASSTILNGVGFARTSFSLPKEKLENIKNVDSKKYFKIEDVYAQFDWISEFGMYFEPTIPFYNGQRYVVYRSIRSFESIKDVLVGLNANVSPEDLNYCLAHPSPFLNTDRDKVRLIKYFEEMYFQMKNFTYDNEYKIVWNNSRCEYLEIWTPTNIMICLNGYIIYDSENPLMNRAQRHPFQNAKFTTSPGVSIGDGAGVLLSSIQKGYDSLYNMAMDSIKMGLGPMILTTPGQFVHNSKSDTTFTREPWGKIECDGPGSFSFLKPPTIDAEVFRILQDQLEMANFAISPANYSDYSTQARSAKDSILRYEGLSDSVATLMESLSEMLNYVAQGWLLDMQEKMPELFELPVFNKAGVITGWKKIKRADLEGKFFFEWGSDSIKDINKLIEKTQLPEIITIAQQLGQNPNTGEWMLDNRGLLRHSLDLYNVDTNNILSDQQISSEIEQDQMKKAELGLKLQQIQQPQQPQLTQENSGIEDDVLQAMITPGAI